MNPQVLMLIWTLVNPSYVTSQTGLAVTQTATVVSAATCEEVKKKIITGPKASGSVHSSSDARVYITIECVPMK